MKMKVANGARALACVVPMLFSAAAGAVEESLSGSACEATNGAYAAQSVGGFGALANKSTTTALQVNCPIPAYYPSGLSVQVSVTKGTAASMTCAVISRNWTNTSGTVTSQVVSGTGSPSFNFGGLPQDDINSVRCDIPKAGGSSAASRTMVNAYYYSHVD